MERAMILLILLGLVIALLLTIVGAMAALSNDMKLTPENMAKKFREMKTWPRRFWKTLNEKDPPKPTSAVGGE